MDERGLTSDDWDEVLAYLRRCRGLLPTCWGTPELRIFREAGLDGVDACKAFRDIFASLISPTHEDESERFTLSMSIQVPLAIGIEHVHKALLDAKHEAIVIMGYCHAVLDHYRATHQI